MVCYSLSNRVGYYVAFLEPLIGFGEREELLGCRPHLPVGRLGERHCAHEPRGF